jgi:hypothetical protein
MLAPGKRVFEREASTCSREIILSRLLAPGTSSFQRRINTLDQSIFFEGLVPIAYRPAVKHLLLHSLIRKGGNAIP